MSKLCSFFLLFLFITISLAAQGSWHPELEHWPRTVLEAEDILTVQERVLYEPYSNFYNIVLTHSELEYSNYSNESSKAEICRNAAFRYLIGSEPLYGDKALEYLLIATREAADGYQETYNNIIWDAENLTSICTAYDFLKGSGYEFGEDETVVRSNIKTIASGLYYDIMENYLIHIGWEAAGKKNNFGVKLASAFGIAAIILNSETSNETEEQPLTWINYSMELLYDIFGQYQVDEDGGWAEGAHYQSYVAYNLIPFLFAHNNFLDGATENYDGLDLPPWLASEVFQSTIDWGIKIRTPLGSRPNFDDSFNTPFYYNGIFAGYYDSDLYAWDYIDSTEPFYSNTNPGDLSIELICQLDDSYSGSNQQDFRSCFLPASGQAVFRSWWDEVAVYMCLLGENGIARTGGLAHEHPDNTSFIIYAGGELLAMDSGYISFDQHDLVRYAKNHSLILVDQEGPSASNSAASGGTNAFIQDFFHLPGLDYSEVSTSYQNTDFSRNVSFLDEAYFIVNDIVSSTEEHTYDWLLHGNGGGDTGNDFLQTENGTTYTVNGVELNLFITSDHIIEFSSYDDYHEQSYDVPGQHTVTKASIQADNAVFSAFLFPAVDLVDIDYTVLELENAAGSLIEWDGTNTISIVKQNNDYSTADLTGTTFTSNAYITNIRITSEELPTHFQIVEGSSLQFSNVDLINSSVINDICLEIDDATASGYVRSACDLTLFTGNLPENVEGAVSYTYDAGILQLSLEDDSYFHLDVNWSLVNTGIDDDVLTETITILENYPNPFNPDTVISFQVSGNTGNDIELDIYNLKGQILKSYDCHSEFIEGSDNQNMYSITWNGTDNNDHPVPSGIYFYRLNAGGLTQTKKMMLLK